MVTTTSSLVRAARRVGGLLAITATAVGISAAAASANPSGGPNPRAGTIAYAQLGDFANGTQPGGPVLGWLSGSNLSDPNNGAPVVVLSVPQQDVSAYARFQMTAQSKADNINRAYQLRIQCADGYVYQGPTQVFTGSGSDLGGGSSIPAGSKALEWPTVADRRILNSTFAKHYQGAGCTVSLATLPASRKGTSTVSVNVPDNATQSPDNPFLNPEGHFEIAVTVSGGAGGSY